MAPDGRRPLHDARRRAPDGPAGAAGLRRPRRRGGHRRRHRRRRARAPAALVAEGALGKSGRGLYDALTMRVFRIPFSTNVERVALAPAHKAIAIDWVDVDPDDRSRRRRALAARISCPCSRPTTARSWPTRCAIVRGSSSAGPSRRCGRPPRRAARRSTSSSTGSTSSGRARPTAGRRPPDRSPTSPPARPAARAARLAAPLRGACSTAATTSWATTLGAADVCAFPFLRYGVLSRAPDDTDPFHHVLAEHLPIAGALPRLEAWVHRVDALPRA